MTLQQQMRRRYRLTVGGLIAAAIIIGMGACSGNPPPDTSQLSVEGLRAYNNYKYVRLINDVTTGVIAGGKAKQIPQPAEVAYLTIAKQVLDVFEADPRSARERAVTIVKNARDGLPATVNAAIGAFLADVMLILSEVSS